jgi:hypothetical protein
VDDAGVSESMEFLARAALIGVGATAVLDLWSAFLAAVFKIPAPDYGLVGRWLGYFPRGQFAHQSIAKSAPIRGEGVIGWAAHYLTGIFYAAAFLLILGLDWARAPTLWPALIFGVVTVVAPFFIMQPGMGAGIAALKTPNPNAARLRSLAAHTVFGVGLFLSALLAAALV